MASDIDSAARLAAQTRAQDHAAKVSRQIATEASSKVSGEVGRARAYTRTFNHAMPIMFDQCYPGFYREEYAKLLVAGSS